MKTATTLLVFCVGALVSLSLVMLYSAGMLQQQESRYLLMQSVWAGIGICACAAAAAIDYHWLRKAAWPLLGLSLVLLALVLFPQFTDATKGARRWFDLGPVRFQPSEAAKLCLIMALAAYAERFQRQMHTFWRGLVIPGLMIGAVLGLIFVEPDRGTTVLLAAVSGVVLLVAGVRWHYLIPPALAGAVALAFSLANDPMRMKRIMSWLHPEQYREATGYQAWQAMVALGSGGWHGLGLGNGRQKLGFVPEHHTDFIFSVIGEELGLVATLGVVLAFVVLVICGIVIAWNSDSVFGLLLGTGITFLIGLQAFINIGVVTGVLPNKGMALPFISYGGSSLVTMLTSVGILLSIARRHGEVDLGRNELVQDTEVLTSQFA